MLHYGWRAGSSREKGKRTGFVLQENPNLSNPAGWTNVSGSILDDGTHKSIGQSAAATNRFYRLQKP